MRDKVFEEGVLGEKFWSTRTLSGSSYSAWYYDTYERGLWNIYNMKDARSFYLEQHYSFGIYRQDGMDRWEKYLRPGWGYETIARVDGNSIISDLVPIKLPVGGFGGDIGHSDYLIKKTVGFRKMGLDMSREDVAFGSYFPSMIRLAEARSVYDLSPDHKAEPLIGEVIKTYNFTRGGWFNTRGLYQGEFACYRGILADDFVKSYVNEEGKLYQMESFTKLIWPGDLLAKDRISLSCVNSEYYTGRVVGRDLKVEWSEEKMVGLFQLDEWLRILKPLVTLHWAGEFTMALTAGFVAVTFANGFYFVVYKVLRFIDDDTWDPSVQYYCLWDHRHIDVKTLEWAYLNHMREAFIFDSQNYFAKYQWGLSHCLSSGYSLSGFSLRLYEWFDLCLGGVVF